MILSLDLGTSPDPPPLEVVAAVDPGSAHLGICLLRRTAARPRLVHLSSLEVGHLAERRQPKIIPGRREGEPDKILTHRRALSPEDVDRLVTSTLELLVHHGATTCLIEWVTDAHLEVEASPSAHASIATHLARAQWVGGELRRALTAIGLPTILVSSTSWRAALRRAAAKQGTPLPALGGRGTALTPYLEAQIDGWPESSNEHARDAAGAALAHLLPSELTASPQTARPALPRLIPAAPRPKRPRGPRGARKPNPVQRAAQQARLEGGCVGCPAKHRIGCPMFQPKALEGLSESQRERRVHGRSQALPVDTAARLRSSAWAWFGGR